MIIYSCITNGYDEITDTHYYDPDVRYVMFHDGTVEKKGAWEFIDIRDYCNVQNPRDLALFPKVNPHLLFDKGEDTIWVDGCYAITKDFVEISKKLFPLRIIKHVNRFSYYEEMLEGYNCAWFTEDDVIDVTKYLYDLGYNFLKYRRPLCAIIWRTITDEIAQHGDLWWNILFAGKDYVPCRDQIAFDAAFQLLNIDTPTINRDHCGMNMGFVNKVGRKKKLHQRGNKDQYLRSAQLIDKIIKYTKLSPKLYCKYDHSWYMKFYNIL
jgi:hypothetical protein